MNSTKVALVLVVLVTLGCVVDVTANLNIAYNDAMALQSQGIHVNSAYNYDLDVAEHKKKKHRGGYSGYSRGHSGGGGDSSEERR